MVIEKEKRIVPLKFDLMFKKVFGDKDDLMPLKKLLECILEIKPKNIIILNPEIIGSSYYDKRTIVDLIVELEDDTQIGIEDIDLAKDITKGDVSMEEILKKVEDFSDDEEILGAYDAEWHKQQIEESIIQTRLDEEQERLEKAEAEGLAKGMAKGMARGIEQEKINIVRNLKKEHSDINFISKVTGLSIGEIKKIN